MKKEKNNRKIADTALGHEPADMVITDGLLMDVYTGRILPGRSVAIRDRWIAYVGPDAGHTIGEKTEVIEADGRLIYSKHETGRFPEHQEVIAGLSRLTA